MLSGVFFVCFFVILKEQSIKNNLDINPYSIINLWSSIMIYSVVKSWFFYRQVFIFSVVSYINHCYSTTSGASLV